MTGLVQTDPDGVMSQISNGFDWGYFEYNDAPAYVDDTTSTPDYQRAAWAVTQIEDAPNQVQPLFVSVGFYRPHLPHYCPKRFFDLIPEPLTDVPYLASDLDDVADPMGERSTDADLAFASVRDGIDYENQHARAYVACVAFVDELLGMLLDAIDGSPEDWLAVLWGDHGFQLGEKDRWRKLTLWERGTRTTLVMAGPGLASGVEIDLAVSLLDLYPTLADYAGLEIPAHLEGESFRRFLDGPGFDTPIRLVLDQSGERYLAFKSRDWSYIVNTVSETEELYDRLVDPAEWWNVADDPANEPVKEWLVPEPSMHFGLCAGAAMAALMASAGHIARARAGARASHRAHVAQPARSARESRLRVSPRRANELPSPPEVPGSAAS